MSRHPSMTRCNSKGARSPLAPAMGVLTALLCSALCASFASAEETRQETVSAKLVVMSALKLDQRDPDCNATHAHVEYIYAAPVENQGGGVGSRRLLEDNVIAASEPVWVPIAEGQNLAEKYGVINNDLAAVTFNVSSSGSGRRLQSVPDGVLDSILVTGPAQPKEYYDGKPIILNSTTYIISMCGWQPAMSKADFEAQWYNTSGQLNIQDYHRACMYNKVNFAKENNIVIGPIEVPCSGTLWRGSLSYEFDSKMLCTAPEQFAWKDYAEAYAREKLKLGDFLDSQRSRRIIVILPREVRCPWAGISPVGCGGRTCTMYIKGGYARDLGVIFHEMGHAQGLSHSGFGRDEYGDRSDVMGDDASPARGYLCFNSANLWRVNWASPVAMINSSNANIKPFYTIPASSISDISMVVFNFSIPKVVRYPQYFVSLRSKTSTYDNILASDLSDRVFIHNFNGTTWDRDFNRSLVLRWLRAGESWTSPYIKPLVSNGVTAGGGVKISVLSITPGKEATFKACRFLVQSETGDDCFDGVDNDCDGATDEQDTDCGGSGAKPSPSPVRNPSPSPTRSPSPAPSPRKNPPPSPRNRPPSPRPPPVRPPPSNRRRAQQEQGRV